MRDNVLSAARPCSTVWTLEKGLGMWCYYVTSVIGQGMGRTSALEGCMQCWTCRGDTVYLIVQMDRQYFVAMDVLDGSWKPCAVPVTTDFTLWTSRGWTASKTVCFVQCLERNKEQWSRCSFVFSYEQKSLKTRHFEVFIGLGIEDRCPRSFCGNHKMAWSWSASRHLEITLN